MPSTPGPLKKPTRRWRSRPVLPETEMFPAKSGPGYFGIKRFDRLGNQRVHMHTISGLLNSDHRLPSLDGYPEISVESDQLLQRGSSSGVRRAD
jgi:serine/threonine-protein kinase HipA